MVKHVAIIGLGSIGRRHLRLIRDLRPDINIIVVRSGKGEYIQEEKLADTVYFSLRDAIGAGIQAAVIATPAICHVTQAKYLMEAGVHVLVEKPLSHSMENVNELININQKSGAVGLVGYCLRYGPAALKFKEMLNDKKIGEILHVTINCGSYLPHWRPDQDYRQSVSATKELGGGVLLELSHELDYIRWFFGDIKSVYANIQNSGTLDINVEDSADIIFESEPGFPVSVHLDFNSRNTRRKCIARCSNGDLIWDAVVNKVIWLPANGSVELATYRNDRDYIYKEQLKHFFDCIENKKLPSVSIHDGVAVLHMIDSIKKSHNIGEKVALA
jgi:predicted dehydrogenase